MNRISKFGFFAAGLRVLKLFNRFQYRSISDNRERKALVGSI